MPKLILLNPSDLKKLCIFFLLSLLTQKSIAQSVDWVTHCGGVNDDVVADIAVDSFGNIFTTGQLGNYADFNDTTLSGGIFAAKYNTEGILQWVVAYGDSNSYGKGICLDSEGNIYVVGWMNHAMQVGDTFLTELGSHDMIFLKFSPGGNLVWVKQFGGSESDKAVKIICDEHDHLYFTGFFSSTAVIGSFSVSAVGTLTDIFLARCDTAGNILWVKTAGGAGDDQSNSLAVDGYGNVFITGPFQQSALFDGITIVSHGLDDIYIAKYDSSGSFKWVRSAGSNEKDKGLGICASSTGNCYVTGFFENTVAFGTFQLTSASGSKDIFVSCYSPGGTCRWVKQASSNGLDRSTEIKITDEGKLVVGGSFEISINFGGLSLSANGNHDIFTARYDTLGALETAQKAGGSGDDRCFTVIPEKNNRLIAGGFFSGTSTFGNYMITSNGAEDAVTMKTNMSSLHIISLSDSLLCAGQPFDVNFIAEGTFLAGNVFTVQLSNSSGSFSTYTNIGSLNSIYSGVVHATIPTAIVASNNYQLRISSTNSGCFGMFYVPIAVHSIPSLLVTGNSSLCIGDSTALVVSGALTYNWIPASGLNSAVSDSVIAFPIITTTYFITGTDQYGCIATVTKTLSVYEVNPYVAISASGSTNICEGQTVHLSAAYFTGTTYQWQLNGSNIAGASSYSYYANQSGDFTCIGSNPCGSSISNSISVVVNLKPTVTIGSFLPICQGSPSFALSGGLPLGGTYSGSYVSLGNFTPSTVGNFTITYTFTDSNGCSNAATSSLLVLSNPSVTWGSVTTSYCETDMPFSLSGGSPTGGEYSGAGVSNGIFDPAAAGPGTHVLSYTFTNINGCHKTVTKNFTVTVPPAISLTIDTFICIYETAFTLTGGVPAGGTYFINGTANSVFDPFVLGIGDQEVVYKVNSGSCTVYDTAIIHVDVCVGINETSSSSGFVLFPNPSSGKVNLESNIQGEKISVKVFDALGQLKYKFNFTGQDKTVITLDLQFLAAGIYSLQLSNDDSRWTKLLIIE